jgi:hypothetical protein
MLLSAWAFQIPLLLKVQVSWLRSVSPICGPTREKDTLRSTSGYSTQHVRWEKSSPPHTMSMWPGATGWQDRKLKHAMTWTVGVAHPSIARLMTNRTQIEVFIHRIQANLVLRENFSRTARVNFESPVQKNTHGRPACIFNKKVRSAYLRISHFCNTHSWSWISAYVRVHALVPFTCT